MRHGEVYFRHRVNEALMAEALFCGFCFTAIVLATSYLPRQRLKNVLQIYSLSGVAMAIMTIAAVPAISYRSQNGYFLAILFPLALALPMRWFSVPLLMLGICMTEASIPIGVLAVGVSTFMWITGRRWKAIALFAGLMTIGYFSIGDFLSDSDRFGAYKLFMEEWFYSGAYKKLFGFGPGSFEIISQVIQVKYQYMVHFIDNHWEGEWYLQMHSDILQTIFELGLVGFLLALWALLDAWEELRILNPYWASSFMALLSATIFDFPLRQPFIAMLLIILLFLSVRRGRGTVSIDILTKKT